MINLKIIRDAGFAGKAAPADAGPPGPSRGKGKGGGIGGGKKGGVTAAQLLTNLYAWWDLDDAANGTRLCANIPHHLLDLNSGVAQVDQGDGNGLAASFPGTNQLLYADPQSANVGGNGGDYSISGWFYLPTWDHIDNEVAYGNSYNAARGWFIRLKPTTGYVDFFATTSNNTAFIAESTNASAGAWHHVYAEYSGTVIGISVDNETLITTETSYTPKVNANYRFAFGRDSFGLDEFYSGYLRHAGHWLRILTAEERTFLYDNPDWSWTDMYTAPGNTPFYYQTFTPDAANDVSLSNRLGQKFRLTQDMKVNTLRVYGISAGTERVMIHRQRDGATIASADIVVSTDSWADSAISEITLSAAEQYTISSRRTNGVSRLVTRNPSVITFHDNIDTGDFPILDVSGTNDALPTGGSGSQYPMASFGYV